MAETNSSSSPRNNNHPTYHQLNLSSNSIKSTSFLCFYLLFIFFSHPVLRAKIDPACITKKPSAYVEVSVDGKVVRKTETVKSTHEPTWANESFTMYNLLSILISSLYNSLEISRSLVTTASKCYLRVYSHSTFRRDVLIGEARMDINKQLVKVQGKFDNTSLTLDIKVNYTHFTPYFFNK